MSRQQEVAAVAACQLAEQMAQQQLTAKQAAKQVSTYIILTVHAYRNMVSCTICMYVGCIKADGSWAGNLNSVAYAVFYLSTSPAE